MFTFLELDNYRGFEHYRLNDLRRVNLLVGKNNCGKTSVLEAVQLLASGSPKAIVQQARQRGEVSPDESEDPLLRGLTNVSHFFYGHEVNSLVSFQLEGDWGLQSLNVSVWPISKFNNKGSNSKELSEDWPTELAVSLECGHDSHEVPDFIFPISDDGAFIEEQKFLRRHLRDKGPNSIASVRLVGANSLDPHEMRAMWDDILLASQEGEVVNAMGILEPDLLDINFLSGAAINRSGRGEGTIVVRVEGSQRRIPLGSFGDGMRRLLALALALIQTRDGILLIDEVDTGLHYSVMADLWKLIVSAAIKSNVQVFATTHSLDCIQGLAEMCEHEPELADEVSLQKLDRRLDEAVSLHSEQIQIADRQEIEVR